ncbi:MAG TPA: hypothetical protein VH084_28355 [Mycobacterium sp.]|jgi:hypothetical protein|nr:hypothetical protein [Mycobacterium sp.]
MTPPEQTDRHDHDRDSVSQRKRDRINLLNLAVTTARDDEARPLDLLRRFESARIDVMVDAVMDRTLSALDEASDYLLDKGNL